MNKVDLSVVIACYNVGDYLTPCLTSLVNTNFPHNRIEILPVDDGSTDGKTAEIIDDFAAHYPFVHALHKKNGGLSDARNYGMDRAHGKYIAFVDGDDTVPPNAYTNMMYVAETYHSNVISGFVRRFDNLKNVGSYLHKFAIKDNKFHTTIAQTPSLIYDTTAWNKLYKMSFLKKHKLRFIYGILYEDLPFELKAHLLSDNDSIIRNNVYNWRWRPNSITESRSALSNFISRINSLNRCRHELMDAGYGQGTNLYHVFIHKILLIDLPIFLQNTGDTTESYVYKIQELVYKFLRDWGLLKSPELKHLPIKFQILYYAIKSGNLDLLRKYTYIQSLGTFSHTKFTKHYNYNIALPEDVKKHLDFKHNTLRSTQTMTKLSVDDETNNVYGYGMFKIKHLHMIKKMFSLNNYHEKLSAQLYNLDNQKAMPINFSRKKTPRYKRIMHPKTSWTNSRYKMSFNYPKACKTLGAGTWVIKVTDNIDNKYIVTALLGKPNKARKCHIPTEKTSKILLRSGFNTSWELRFKAMPLKEYMAKNYNWVKDAKVKGNSLIFHANLTQPKETVPRIIFNNSKDLFLDGKVISKHNRDYIVFDLSKWSKDFMNKAHALKLVHIPTNHNLKYRYQISSDATAYHTFNVGDTKQALVYYGNRRHLRVAYRFQPIEITRYSIVNKNALKVSAKINPKLISSTKLNKLVKIEMITGGLKHRYLLTASKKQITFNGNEMTFEIPLLSSNRKQLLVLAGNYHFIAYLPMNNKKMRKVDFEISTDKIMPDSKELALKSKDVATYEISQNRLGSFRFHMRQPRVGFTKKRSHRAIAYSLLYPLMRKFLPLRNVAVFDSYWASQYSSNEKAIYQYMRKHYPHVKPVWFFKNDQTPIDGKAKRVRTRSLKYWYYLAVARYIFQNTNMPNRYDKRAGQIETETLHGTFLKHMGFDEPHFKNARKKTQNNFARRIRRWDYMVVPSNYMRKIASRAFDYHQRILPYGFPRTDELVKHNNAKYISKIKSKLHIPKDKKVILYAPTFRNHDRDLHFDLDKLEKDLGNRYVLLIRLHYFVAHSNSFYDNPGFVYDVSDYPDINDLFLISDVMITDYSSVMFDYANLKRPMIFYPYDEDMYLDDEYRGTYLDYEHAMPGPIVNTQDGVEHCLNNLKEVKNKYHQKLIDFNHRFDEFDDTTHSTAKVTDAIMHTDKSKLDQEPDHGIVLKKFCHWLKITDLQAGLLHHLGNILPTKNIIIFDSFFGTSFSDNPKALYLYIKKHYPKYKLYWNVNINDVPYFRAHHIPYVIRFSYSGIKKQAEAKYWIVNARRPFRWRVPKGAKVLQTWHGTPLKTIGADVALVTMPGNNAKRYHKQVYKDDKRWDYLIAPNQYSNKIMQRAFRMDTNQMMLTGYPRNDILVNHDDKSTISRIKSELGISPWKKVILYAPTWRDNDFIKSDEYVAHLHLDLDKIRKHYGHKVVVLVRTHYMISNHLDLSKYRDIAINVSSYPDISKLYLISDALITDYSSVMFDYSILKRPIIFFDYDYANYAESTRGFYFNFKKVAPGPIVTNTDQVIKQLDKALSKSWKPSTNYQRFVNRFDKWMDGKSSARVAKQLLSGQNVEERFYTPKELSLPKQVYLKDGAIMWEKQKDFTKRHQSDFVENYNFDDQKFKVLKGMQLQSTSFHQPLGFKYILVKPKYNSAPVWVSLNDVVTNQNLNP